MSGSSDTYLKADVADELVLSTAACTDTTVISTSVAVDEAPAQPKQSHLPRTIGDGAVVAVAHGPVR